MDHRVLAQAAPVDRAPRAREAVVVRRVARRSRGMDLARFPVRPRMLPPALRHRQVTVKSLRRGRKPVPRNRTLLETMTAMCLGVPRRRLGPRNRAVKHPLAPGSKGRNPQERDQQLRLNLRRSLEKEAVRSMPKSDWGKSPGQPGQQPAIPVGAAAFV